MSMQIFVNSVAYQVDPACEVDALKRLIENQTFVPVDQMRLTWTNGRHEGDEGGGGGGTSVLDGGTLAGYGVQDDDELVLGVQVPVGMRAKWRKKRMRRLRRKRRKMRQRAR